MKKAIIGAIAAGVALGVMVAVLAVTREPEPTGGFDFRKVRWGMSPAQVEAAEKKDGLVPLFRRDNMTVYETTINGEKFNLGYEFVNDKLAKAGYILNENFINANNYVKTFEGLKKLLVENYGNPLTDETTWSNDFLKNKPDMIGNAYAAGSVESVVVWETEKTKLGLEFFGERMKVKINVVYFSKMLDSEFQAAKKNRDKGLL